MIKHLTQQVLLLLVEDYGDASHQHTLQPQGMRHLWLQYLVTARRPCLKGTAAQVVENSEHHWGQHQMSETLSPRMLPRFSLVPFTPMWAATL